MAKCMAQVTTVGLWPHVQAINDRPDGCVTGDKDVQSAEAPHLMQPFQLAGSDPSLIDSWTADLDDVLRS